MKSPMSRARSFLLELAREDLRYGAGSWYVVFNGQIVLSDQSQERLAEMFADDRKELADGFLKKPRGREQTIHD